MISSKTMVFVASASYDRQEKAPWQAEQELQNAHLALMLLDTPSRRSLSPNDIHRSGIIRYNRTSPTKRRTEALSSSFFNHRDTSSSKL